MDHDRDVHVEYKESGKKWCFNPDVLEKVSSYAVGQAVRVRDRGTAYEEMIKQLRQTGREVSSLLVLCLIIDIHQYFNYNKYLFLILSF